LKQVSPINNPSALSLRRLRQERCAILRLRKDVQWMLGVRVLEDSASLLSCFPPTSCVVCLPAQSSCHWQSPLLSTVWADDLQRTRGKYGGQVNIRAGEDGHIKDASGLIHGTYFLVAGPVSFNNRVRK
jgi:hypothetical protein